ncbi:MAG: hypothetical protein GY814_01370, partial [Gammaproteobacteria bacterium]|nr:hypothetical protein [Gammaproteobacteria bacterium]
MISKPYLIAARRLYAACSGFGAAIQRYILSLSGSSYMELSEPVTLAMGDTVSIQGVTATTGVSQTLFGSDGASKLLLEIDAAGLLQLTNCTATINGVAVSDGASISADLTDVNTFEVTATGACSISHIGQNGSNASFWIGNTLDLTINGVEWDIDSGSILYQLPVGGSLGGDVVVNGTFDTDLSGWEASTNWVWASPGVAQH